MQTDKTLDPSCTGDVRTKELAIFHCDEIAKQPNESRKASLRTKFGMNEKSNPLFDLSVDLFRLVYYCLLST